MAVIETLQNEGGTAVIEVCSDGWSGDIVRRRPYGVTPDYFQFDIDFTWNGEDPYPGKVTTLSDNKGFVTSGNDAIIGISLESMGNYIDGNGQSNIQFLGVSSIPDWDTRTPSWGGDENELNVYCDDIYISHYTTQDPGDGSETEYIIPHVIDVSAVNNVGALYMRWEYVGGTWHTIVTTDLPIFRTDADLLEFIQSDGTYTDKILNLGSGPDPEEDYKNQFEYWFVKNKWGHNTRNISGASVMSNYRFYPKRKGIAFVKHTPTAAEPYDRVLVHYSAYTWKFAPWGADNDDDFTLQTDGHTTFLAQSISFASDDYYTKFAFETNIPLWNTQQDADDYFNGLKDISEAENYPYISRKDDYILNPDLPGTDEDESTDIGTNGMRYSYGNRLYEISNAELANLMTELFDPANLQDILDGTKLFGSNNMEAVSGVLYIPLTDLSEICSLGSLSNIKIGAWTSDSAEGKRIIDNEGTIDCGSFFYGRIYQDFRDYEPYNLLFANLPFVGMHQLTISKYIDKTVSVSYNIDVCTGAIVCKLFADSILVDVFDGTCGASRPISATDNNAYINNVVSAITGASANASGSIEGITNSVSQIGGAMGAGGAAGAAMLASGGTLMAMGATGGAVASGIYQGYQIKNAVDNPPQMHRGSLVGNLAYNLNTKPTFIFFTKRTIRPENELDVIGYPSGHGGQISGFSGFLSASAVKLSSFAGTETEQNELLNILQGGIYI